MKDKKQNAKKWALSIQIGNYYLAHEGFPDAVELG